MKKNKSFRPLIVDTWNRHKGAIVMCAAIGAAIAGCLIMILCTPSDKASAHAVDQENPDVIAGRSGRMLDGTATGSGAGGGADNEDMTRRMQEIYDYLVQLDGMVTDNQSTLEEVRLLTDAADPDGEAMNEAQELLQERLEGDVVNLGTRMGTLHDEITAGKELLISIRDTLEKGQASEREAAIRSLEEVEKSVQTIGREMNGAVSDVETLIKTLQSDDKTRNKEMIETLSEMKNQMTQTQEKGIAEVNDAIADWKKKVQETSDELREDVRKQIKSTGEQTNDRLDQLDHSMDGRFSSLNSQIGKEMDGKIGALQNHLGEKIGAADERIENVGSRLEGVDTKLGGVGTKIEGVDMKLGSMDTKMEGVDTKLGGVDTKLGSMDTKMEGVDTKLGGVDTKLGSVDTKMEGVDSKLGGVDTKLEGVDTKLGGVDAKLDGVDNRIGGVDTKIEGVDTKLSSLDVRMDGIHDGMEEKLGGMHENLTGMDTRLGGMDTKLDKITLMEGRLDESIGGLNGSLEGKFGGLSDSLGGKLDGLSSDLGEMMDQKLEGLSAEIEETLDSKLDAKLGEREGTLENQLTEMKTQTQTKLSDLTSLLEELNRKLQGIETALASLPSGGGGTGGGETGGGGTGGGTGGGSTGGGSTGGATGIHCRHHHVDACYKPGSYTKKTDTTYASDCYVYYASYCVCDVCGERLGDVICWNPDIVTEDDIRRLVDSADVSARKKYEKHVEDHPECGSKIICGRTEEQVQNGFTLTDVSQMIEGDELVGSP
ncbi:MAG: hypothetical protein K5696_05395 [Lachnospiraceae bacterium]|nr:hypothetical protein [Lachnospiraceae bacterium]